MDFQIQEPQKKEFKFNEVVSLTDVKPYVLRFWETEFIQINPIQRDDEKIYSKKDILVIKTIKKLLFTDKLAIPEAKNVLDKELAAIESAPISEETIEEPNVDVLEQSKDLKTALEEIINSHSLTSAKVEVETEIEIPQTENELAQNVSDELTLNQPSSEREYAKRSTSLASKLKLDFKTHNRELSNQDIVNLVNSKRKLSKLLGQIQELEQKYNWV